MKIVQAVGWYHPDSLGGTEVYVASLARLFRVCGHQVAIAAPDPRAAAPRSYQHEGCDVFRYPIPAAPTRDEAQGRVVVRGAPHFHRWLRDARADVVHFHTFVTGLGLHELDAARRAGSRVIATTHASSLGFVCQRGTLMLHGLTMCDGIVDQRRCAACDLEHRGAGAPVAAALARIPAAVGEWAGALPGRVGTALGMTALIARNQARQREMFELLDSFVVLSRRAADIVLANGAPPDKVVVNRLGVSQPLTARDHSRVGQRNLGVRVGYVGRFDPIKGVSDIGTALRSLPADVPIRFEFRGPVTSEAERRLRSALERSLSDDPRVAFAEALAPDAIPDVMRSYDVLCCPSRCLEGGPTVGLEAIAVGTPVIAADAGGLAEVLVDGVNGRLVPPGDVDALTAALEEVGRSPEATLDRWRTALPRPRTMHEVAADYLSLYARVN